MERRRLLIRNHRDLCSQGVCPPVLTVDAVTNKHQEEQKRKEEDDNK